MDIKEAFYKQKMNFTHARGKSAGFKKLTTTSKTTIRNTNGLRKGNTYYYKVRAYKYLKGKYYYSGWSNVRSCKISK